MDLTAPSNWSNVSGSFVFADGVWTIDADAWPPNGIFEYSGGDIVVPYSIVVNFELFYNDYPNDHFIISAGRSTSNLYDVSSGYLWSADYPEGAVHQYILVNDDPARKGEPFGAFHFGPRYPRMVIHSIGTLESLFWTNFRGQIEI